jgi:uncharacterized DUF497 family protein
MNVDTVFTWDQAKAERNLQVHGISFETAREAFGDPHQVVQENDFDGDEQRYVLIGLTRGLILLLVVFVDRATGSETETLRLISARKANEYEKSAYADQFR